MDDLWVSFCEYGEGAATVEEKDDYTVTRQVSKLLKDDIPCHRKDCGGRFDIIHLLAANPKFWRPPVQQVKCSNRCGNYLEIVHVTSPNKE